MMKQFRFFAAFALLATAMTFSLASCGDDDDDNGGGDDKTNYAKMVVGQWLMTETRNSATDSWSDATWTKAIMQFDAGGKYYNFINGVLMLEGTYTVAGKKININITKGSMKTQTFEILSISDSKVELALYTDGSTTPSAYYRYKRVTDDNGGDEEKFENKSFTVGGVKFKMVAVVGGTFQMGASSTDKDANDNEFPQHKVTLSDYYIGETEVTQALWKAVMELNPSDHKGDNFPVEQVSWKDCQVFITKLNQLTGLTFHLPTEAEWEYAARGGSKSKGYRYSGSNDVNVVAWYDENSGYETHAVGTKVKNELGIYDMCGNVWEWCLDWEYNYTSDSQTNPTGPSSGKYRIFRGGGYWSDAEYCRSTCRLTRNPDESDEYTGFRLALSK